MNELSKSKEIKFISIDNLVFDPKNPRLPTAKAGAKDQDIYRYMLEKSNLIDIMLSIATQDYFVGEPLLVTPSKVLDNHYEVLEGNRRLAALKILQNPSIAPIKKDSIREIAETATYRPNQIPALIYDSRDEVLLYLGYRHITGVDEWDSLAKAKYLTQLKDTYKEFEYIDVLKDLAKIIGSRSDYVHKLLSGYQVFKMIEKNNFFGINDLDEDNFPFSLLTTALSYTNISKYIGLSPDAEKSDSIREIKSEQLKDIAEWMFKQNEGRTRLGESRNLRNLSAVVSVPRALKAFKEQNRPLEEATLFTDEPYKHFSNSIQQSLTKLKDARDASHHVPNPSESDYSSLLEMAALVRELSVVVKNKIDNQEIG